jgi:hypothetical protein
MATPMMNTTPRDRRSRSSERGFPHCSAESVHTWRSSNVQRPGSRMAPTESAHCVEVHSHPNVSRHGQPHVPACSAALPGVRRPPEVTKGSRHPHPRMRTLRERMAETATTVRGQSSRTRRCTCRSATSPRGRARMCSRRQARRASVAVSVHVRRRTIVIPVAMQRPVTQTLSAASGLERLRPQAPRPGA